MHIPTTSQPVARLGIGSDSCNWGTHIGGLYTCAHERDQIVFSIIAQGIRDGDVNFYAAAGQLAEIFPHSFGLAHPELTDELADSTLVIDTRDLFFPKEEFIPASIGSATGALLHEHMLVRDRNIRFIADMSWAYASSVIGFEQVTGYECAINREIASRPHLCICLYDVRLLNRHSLMDVLRTHPLIICEGTFAINPYYEDPAGFVPEYTPLNLTDTQPCGVSVFTPRPAQLPE